MKQQGKRWGLSAQIFLGLALGVAAGLAFQGAPGPLETVLRPVGTLFLNLLKMLVVPLVFSSIAVGACGLGNAGQVGRIGVKAVAFYLVTTALAVTLGLFAANLFPVGRGLGYQAEGTPSAPAESPGLLDTLLDIVPTNPVAALAEGNMLQIILFAVLLGGALLLIGEKGRPLRRGLESLAEAMYALTGAVMKLAPIAVFALIAPIVASYGREVLPSLLGLATLVYAACAVHMLVVYSAAVAGLGRLSPLRFFREALPALLFAFSSASSSATLPFSMEAAERLGASAPVRSFVLPLGATINMDGTAIYQGICALFIANAYGIPLSLGQQAVVVLTCTLASIGTAGVPGAGVVMLTMVLESVGLPIEGAALVAGIDRVLDMARTSVNVAGDLACAAVVAASERRRAGRRAGADAP